VLETLPMSFLPKPKETLSGVIDDCVDTFAYIIFNKMELIDPTSFVSNTETIASFENYCIDPPP